MCTLTWGRFSDQNGYYIHFNRDESRLRSKGLLPSIQTQSDTEFIAPIDPQANGTWILANEYGFSACLLNNYIDVQHIDAIRSRGLLVKDLACASSSREALDRITKTRMGEYSPFDLFLFDNKQVIEISWNGENENISTPTECFKSSSGYEPEKVIAGRKKQFEKTEKTPEGLRNFHASHNPDKGPYSVCMHREDACTQSYTEIHVSNGRAKMSYCDGPPCSGNFSKALEISLNTGVFS